MKSTIIQQCIVLLLFPFSYYSLNTLIWPDPMHMTNGDTLLPISESFIILYQGPNRQLIDAAIRRTYKKMFSLGCYPGAEGKKGLEVLILNVQNDFDIEQLMPAPEDEYYSLNIKDGEVFGVLSAITILGALRGLETFSQLIQVSKSVPSWAKHDCQLSQYYIYTPVSIQDQPVFVHRGLLLDTARHYMPKRIIKRVLDGMEASKLNVLHWHIIDSQSFPVQSHVLPNLSEEGAYSEFEVYTIQDMKDIVQYARNRGVRVIPEFDIPGHAYSWKGSDLVVCLDAKPWEKYCAGPPCGQLDISKNETYVMLHKFIKEMASVFPSHNIHLGHDEVNKACYLDDPKIKDLIESGTDLETLLQIFQDKVQKIAKNVGKNIIFWEEVILDFPTKVPIDTIIQTWRGTERARLGLERGYRVIVSDYTSWYLDCGHGNWVYGNTTSWCDPFHTWANVYMLDPVANLTDHLKKNVLGGETAAWSELINPYNVLAIIFPRASAAAESLWSAPKSRDWKKAANRMDRFVETLNQRGVDCSPIWPTYCSKRNCLD